MRTSDLPILSFDSPKKWNQWLLKNHKQSSGIWVRFFKINSNVSAINYKEALDEALCYGWIDSQVKKYDEISYLQKFTPRSSKSMWSKVNINHIERLIKAGKVTQAGMKQIEEAKKDGRWQRAYDSQSTMKLPQDFLSAISQNKQANEFFRTLNKTNIYTIAWRLQTAIKPETRAKRLHAIIDMLSKGEKFH